MAKVQGAGRGPVRRVPLLLPLLLVFTLPLAGAASISDPSFTNLILRVTSTPQLGPGDQGNLTLVLRNPYSSPMGAPFLRVEIYRYVSNRENLEINASLKSPVFALTGQTSVLVIAPDIVPGGNQTKDLGILTTAAVPHGRIFDQGTYLVRFRLEFDLVGSRRLMVSPGYFTSEQWLAAHNPQSGVDPTCLQGGLDFCYLGRLFGRSRVDGIIPDTSFGVRETLPSWPFYVLGIGSGLMAVGAGVAFVLEHPGRYPRVEGPLRRLLRRRPSKPS